MRLLAFRRTLIAAAAAIGALCVASAPFAAAATRAAPNQRVRHGTSGNWSGYAVSGAGPYRTVSASWTQPAVNCAATEDGFSAFWVGLDGDTTKTVEQTGSEANCSSGIAQYAAWYEMYPKRPVIYANPVSAGDSLSASVTAVGRGRFKLTLSDTTKRWSLTTSQKRRSALRGSAEVIAEAPSTRKQVLPLADFGTIGFSGASVDGSLLESSTPGLEPITMASGEIVKATPSSLSGGGFSDTWHHE
jgi:peptidase A4-like protein